MAKTVFVLRADVDHYVAFLACTDKGWEKFELFDGRPLLATWSPVEVEEDHEEGRGDRPNGDFPSLLRHVPVFSARAVEALRPILSASGEILPLTCKKCRGGPYFAFNVKRFLNVLDRDRSKIKYFSTGRVMRVLKYELVENLLTDSAIFKIPEMARSEVFVDDQFASAVASERLTGFSLEKVWPHK